MFQNFQVSLILVFQGKLYEETQTHGIIFLFIICSAEDLVLYPHLDLLYCTILSLFWVN